MTNELPKKAKWIHSQFKARKLPKAPEVAKNDTLLSMEKRIDEKNELWRKEQAKAMK